MSATKPLGTAAPFVSIGYEPEFEEQGTLDKLLFHYVPRSALRLPTTK